MTGQPVVYRGAESSVDIYNPKSIPSLRPGHPGRIFDPSPQHIRVNWFGLEGEPVSFATGFTRDDSGISVPGLAWSDETEYAELARAIRKEAADRWERYG